MNRIARWHARPDDGSCGGSQGLAPNDPAVVERRGDRRGVASRAQGPAHRILEAGVLGVRGPDRISSPAVLRVPRDPAGSAVDGVRRRRLRARPARVLLARDLAAPRAQRARTRCARRVLYDRERRDVRRGRMADAGSPTLAIHVLDLRVSHGLDPRAARAEHRPADRDRLEPRLRADRGDRDLPRVDPPNSRAPRRGVAHRRSVVQRVRGVTRDRRVANHLRVAPPG